MSLTTLNWKRIGTVTVAGAAINQVLDGVYTALSSSSYYDAASRTPGSGSAWTVSRYQSGGTTEAVYFTPPSASVSYKAILAGAAGAKTPTMASPDTWATSTVLAATAKNTGSYNAWDNAAPFTSGQFYGYWRCVASTITVVKVHVYENQEEILVLFESNTGLMFGAFWQALEVPSGSASASDDSGRRYMMTTSHPTSGISANWAEVNTGWLGHSASATNAHQMALGLGTSTTIYPAEKILVLEGSASSTSFLTDESGAYVVLNCVAFRRSAVAPSDTFLGVARQYGLAGDKVHGTINSTAGTVNWFNVAGNTGSAGNAVALFP